MIDIIDMIDDLNEVEQDVLEEIDPDLIPLVPEVEINSFIKIKYIKLKRS